MITVVVRPHGSNREVVRHLTRTAVHVPAASRGLLVERNVGYVILRRMSEGAAGELQAVVNRLVDEGMTSLVLDLRSDPGGLIREGVAVASLFLQPGDTIATSMGRSPEHSKTYVAGESGGWDGLRLVLLVNRGTASSAELVAGDVGLRMLRRAAHRRGDGIAGLEEQAGDRDALTDETPGIGAQVEHQRCHPLVDEPVHHRLKLPRRTLAHSPEDHVADVALHQQPAARGGNVHGRPGKVPDDLAVGAMGPDHHRDHAARTPAKHLGEALSGPSPGAPAVDAQHLVVGRQPAAVNLHARFRRPILRSEVDLGAAHLSLVFPEAVVHQQFGVGIVQGGHQGAGSTLIQVAFTE